MKERLIKGFVLVVAVIFLASPALAGPDPAESAGVAEAGAVETAGGSCSGCSGWVWAHAKEAWRYVSGSEERIWLYFLESAPGYAQVDTGDARHFMFLLAPASTHWLGTFWTSGTTFSNVRLWYN
jgi:hypothetical protein